MLQIEEQSVHYHVVAEDLVDEVAIYREVRK